MAAYDELVSTISASRRLSQDGTRVIYNLTEGLDFSEPKKVAEALASVIFEKDAVNWFETDGEHINFKPSYKVRVLLAKEHNERIEKTVKDFLEDFKTMELDKKFSSQIKEISSNEERSKRAFGLGMISAILNKPFYIKDDRIEVEDLLLTEILSSLEIRTPDDRDLIDWKNLPI